MLYKNRPEYNDPLYHEKQNREFKNKIDRFIENHPIIRDNHKPIGGILIGICAVIILITVISTIMTFSRQALINSYTPATAKVLDVKMITVHSSRSTNHDYKLIGKYEVDGVEYDATKVVDTYHESKVKTFSVYYNPSVPSDHVVEISGGSYTTIIVRTIFTILLFGAAIALLYKYMKYGYVKTEPDYIDYINEYTKGGNPTAAKMFEKTNDSPFEFYKGPETPDDQQQFGGGNSDFYRGPDDTSNQQPF